MKRLAVALVMALAAVAIAVPTLAGVGGGVSIQSCPGTPNFPCGESY